MSIHVLWNVFSEIKEFYLILQWRIQESDDVYAHFKDNE